ncbi:MAG: hypothetical protein HRU38_14175 [Saccharospirillaceae bacterium]|nr:hypothetical protein [Pseudomonadales bacterium]NRB79790.1 hypothetical protein [Saccharospirillaceae bacterium]
MVLKNVVLIFIVAMTVSCTSMKYQSSLVSLEYLNMDLKKVDAVFEIYGQPNYVTDSGPAYNKYYYKHFEVTAKKEGGFLNSIIIYSQVFVDENGLSVGDSYAKLNQLIPQERKLSENEDLYIYDLKNSISYWFDGNNILKIVLAK